MENLFVERLFSIITFIMYFTFMFYFALSPVCEVTCWWDAVRGRFTVLT